MSYILNALIKSEQDRQETGAESLGSKIYHSSQQPKKTSIALIVLVGFNLALLCFFIWFFVEDRTNAVENKSSLSNPKVVFTGIVKGEIGNELAPTAKQMPLSELSIAQQMKSKKNNGKARVVKQVTKLKKQNKEQLVVEKIKQVKPAEEPVSIIVDNSKPKNEVPFLSELDYDFRRQVPDIDINVFVFSENKKDRFIMVAMKKIKPGQQILPGMILKDILINSLVIEYNNRIFQTKRN